MKFISYRLEDSKWNWKRYIKQQFINFNSNITFLKKKCIKNVLKLVKTKDNTNRKALGEILMYNIIKLTLHSLVQFISSVAILIKTR